MLLIVAFEKLDSISSQVSLIMLAAAGGKAGNMPLVVQRAHDPLPLNPCSDAAFAKE